MAILRFSDIMFCSLWPVKSITYMELCMYGLRYIVLFSILVDCGLNSTCTHPPISHASGGVSNEGFTKVGNVTHLNGRHGVSGKTIIVQKGIIQTLSSDGKRPPANILCCRGRAMRSLPLRSWRPRVEHMRRSSCGRSFPPLSGRTMPIALPSMVKRRVRCTSIPDDA